MRNLWANLRRLDKAAAAADTAGGGGGNGLGNGGNGGSRGSSPSLLPWPLREACRPRTPPANPYLALNVVRATATLGVMMAHVSMLVTRHYGDDGVTPSAWSAASWWQALVMPSGMLLFMLSGSLVLGRSETAGTFCQKRLVRLVFAWLFWSGFYFAWRFAFRRERLDLKSAAWGLLEGDSKVAMYHMWLINHLLKLYSLTPLFNAVFRDPDPTVLRLLLLLSYLVYGYQILGQHFALKMFLFEWLSFLGFRTTLYLSGPTLRMLRTTRSMLAGCAFVYVGSMLNVVVSTGALVGETGRMDEYYYHSLLELLAMSLSAFVFLKTLGELPAIADNASAVKFFNTLGEHSFSMYMIHPAVLDVLRKVLYRPDHTMALGHPIVAIPLTTAVLACTTFAVTVLCKRIPLLRCVL